MPCAISCIVSSVFIISMIYMTNAMSSSQIMEKYKKQLPVELQKTYQEIVQERSRIYYFGYVLGFLLSIVFILYNAQMGKSKMSWGGMVCLVVAVSFSVNYFYYILSPKTKWMLDSVQNPEQTKAWLEMYRAMQVYYHSGLVLGLIAVGTFAYAFRC